MKTLLDLARIVDEIKLIPKQEKNQQATTVSEHRNAEVDSIE